MVDDNLYRLRTVTGTRSAAQVGTAIEPSGDCGTATDQNSGTAIDRNLTAVQVSGGMPRAGERSHTEVRAGLRSMASAAAFTTHASAAFPKPTRWLKTPSPRKASTALPTSSTTR